METLFAKIGGWLWALIPAAFGSAFSLFVDSKKTAELSRIGIIGTFLFGMIIGYIFGSAINEYFKLINNPDYQFIAFANQFVIGMMGIAALVEAKLQIKAAVTALRRKYFGGE